MSQNSKAVDVVREAEALLCSVPQGELYSVEAEEQVRAALRLLGGEEPRWIDLAQATRLLGVMSDATPASWPNAGSCAAARAVMDSSRSAWTTCCTRAGTVKHC